MKKNTGLERLAKLINYTGIVIAVGILYFPIQGFIFEHAQYNWRAIALISAAVYFIFKGISWVVEGFSENN